MIYLIKLTSFVLLVYIFSFGIEASAQSAIKCNLSDTLIATKDSLFFKHELEDMLLKLELSKKQEIAFYDSISFRLEKKLKITNSRKKREKINFEIKVNNQYKKLVDKVYFLNKNDLLNKYHILLRDSISASPLDKDM